MSSYICTCICTYVIYICTYVYVHVHVDVNQQFSNSFTNNCSTKSCDSGTVLFNCALQIHDRSVVLTLASACVFDTSSFEPIFFYFQELMNM